MSKAKIIISRYDKCHNITIGGRATYECSPVLKNFTDNMIHDTINKIRIDFMFCTWMDSTFMGTLAILGLKAKQNNILLEILNIDDKNLKLLKQIGIQKLFTFNDLYSINHGYSYTEL